MNISKNLERFWVRLTSWEQWHYNVKYALLAPAWLWYSIRARSFYFFAPVNPTLTFGGFEGGPKKEIYNHLPLESYPATIYIDPGIAIETVISRINTNGFAFPIAVKPNIGMMGLAFRKIGNAAELAIYHKAMTVEYIVQELITYPLEVSVFYYRHPMSKRGTITGFVRKESLEVVGDGFSTIEQLMEVFTERPGYNAGEWKAKHSNRLQEVLPVGNIFKLSWVANLSRGSRLVSLEEEKDDRILQQFDKISHAAKHFYYGRFDIKCNSITDLKEGRNFSILEFNGAGAEPHHIYGNGNSFLQACKIIIHHWNVLYTIAKYNNRHGVLYPSLRHGIAFTRKANKHFKKLRQLDAAIPVFD